MLLKNAGAILGKNKGVAGVQTLPNQQLVISDLYSGCDCLNEAFEDFVAIYAYISGFVLNGETYREDDKSCLFVIISWEEEKEELNESIS